MGAPFAQRASLARAASSADLASIRLKQLSTGFNSLMRASTARVASTGESDLVR
ncbi:hypothetical protein D3C83_143250 [compost metagenome]